MGRVDMTELSKRLVGIGFSTTLDLAARVAAKRKQGQDILSLGIGEPDFDIPQSIRDAAAAAALRGEGASAPVNGIPTLRSAIAHKLETDNGLRVGAEDIHIAAGSKQVIFNAMLATLNVGDEVIIPAPFWVSYPDIVRLAGGTPVIVQCPAGKGYKLDAEALERAITPRTRWLIINSPNNPTGAVYSWEEIQALGTVLRTHTQVMILSDEIYEFYTFLPSGFASFAHVLPDLSERILTINGFSKTYAMIGWRLGYGAGPSDLIAAMNVILSQSASGTATIVQAGALAAFGQDSQAIGKTLGRIYHDRCRRVAAVLRQAPHLHWVEPEGAFYLYVDCAAYLGRMTRDDAIIDSDVTLAAYLLDEASVVTLPGSVFGLGPALRLACTCPDHRLEEAALRVVAALAALR